MVTGFAMASWMTSELFNLLQCAVDSTAELIHFLFYTSQVITVNEMS